MSTTVIYNGVQLRKCQTRSCRQSAVTDQSGTDPIGDKFQGRWSGIVRAMESGTVKYWETGRDNSVHDMKAISAALLQPRKTLEVYIGGFLYQMIVPPGPDVAAAGNEDINNGPKPISVDITHIAGRSFRVEFEIEATVHGCSGEHSVLSNRWSAHDDIDENMFTTRSIQGVLRVAKASSNPQAWRHLVVPPLQAGFKRTTIDCTTSLDGLTLAYTVIDREVYASCPLPGTTWTGRHSVMPLEGSNGAVLVSAIDINMEGPKNVDKIELIETCALIASIKMDLDTEGNILLDASMVDHLHENRVEFTARVMHAGGKDPMHDYALNTLNFGRRLDQAKEGGRVLPGYDSRRSRAPKIYGTSTTTGLFVSFLQNQCMPDYQHGISRATDRLAKQEPEYEPGEETEVETHEGDIPKDYEISGNYANSHKQNPYSFYQVDVEYNIAESVVQLPIARAAPFLGLNGDTSVFIQLAQPTANRVVRIAGERYGKQVEMPRIKGIQYIGSLKIRLLKVKETPKAPQLIADGKTFLYSFDAEYTYGLSREPTTDEEYEIGKLPWITPHYIPPWDRLSNTNRDIIDGTASG